MGAALSRLCDSRLLDRLIRGRATIAIVAFALIGIVTLQLGLLRLNSSIGRALAREALLQRQNSALSIEDSEMLAGERVEASAERLGMRLTPISELRFLPAAGRAALAPALHALQTPASAADQQSQEGSSSPGGEAAESSSAPGSGESQSGAGGGEAAAASGGEAQSASGGGGEAQNASGGGEASGERGETARGEAPAAGGGARESASGTAGEEPPRSAEASSAGGAQAGGG